MEVDKKMVEEEEVTEWMVPYFIRNVKDLFYSYRYECETDFPLFMWMTHGLRKHTVE